MRGAGVQSCWFIALLTTCASPVPMTPQRANRHTSSAVKPADCAAAEPAPTDPAPIALRPPCLLDALCGGSDGCQLGETLASVADDAGGTRSLIRITFPEGASSEPDADPPCVFEQFWLVAQAADGRVTRQKSFALGCTKDLPDGSWCGSPPSAEVHAEGEIVIAQWREPGMRCMSAFKSYGTETASLRTFHSLRSESTFYRSLEPYQSQTTTWDWQTLQGSFAWDVARDSCPAVRRGPVPVIPELEADASFSKQAWQTVPMQSCATRIDAKNGVSLGGKKAKLGMRAVVIDGFLFVDLEPEPDGALAKAAELRVCAAVAVPVMGPYCMAKEVPECARIGLDGAVLEGSLGVEGGLHVERAPARERFKIPLPLDHGALTLAYVEPKGGRSLSTTPLRPLDTTILSEVFDIEPKLARCEVRAGELMLVRNPEAL